MRKKKLKTQDWFYLLCSARAFILKLWRECGKSPSQNPSLSLPFLSRPLSINERCLFLHKSDQFFLWSRLWGGFSSVYLKFFWSPSWSALSEEVRKKHSEMAEREDNVYKAKLAEQAERYDGKTMQFDGKSQLNAKNVTRRFNLGRGLF